MDSTNKNRWLILSACIMTIILVNLDASAIYLALKSISTDYHISLTMTQWVINTYLLACVIFLIPGGRIADLIGRRTIFLTGTILFLIGSILCAAAPNIILLLIGRVIQGIGFAWTLPLCLVIGANAFPKEQKSKAIGILLIFSGLAQAAGPTVGGAFLTYLDWRWLFWMNIPFCLLCLFLTVKYCDNDKPVHSESFDVLGACLLATALFTLIYAINESGSWGFSSHPFLGTIALSVILFGLFCLRSRKTKHPLIDHQLFKNRVYIGIISVRFFFMLTWSAVLFLLPLFLMMEMRYTVMEAGLVILASTLSTAIISRLAPVLMKHIGIAQTHYFSIILSFIAFVSLHFFDAQTPAMIIYPTLIVSGAAFGLFLNSSVAGNLHAVEPKRHAISSGLLYTMAFSGCATGVALCGAIMSQVSRSHFVGLLSKANKHLSSVTIDSLHNYLVGTRDLANLSHAGLPANVDEMIRQSFEAGFQSAMGLCVIMVMISMLLGLLCFNKQ